ncbi:uncharacterized protein Triagg1_58 [Trichoderma aggressivum f. europaeum]|uniref:Uncharacterized protein n=1 Tax=Trichoderma aggressivum f. europaeum TaxID=173218 RepID=A0AAE1IKR9_9HYPO|nr:hypothetical protein Triagg1_58 [Trichoderma aggressivum f. europaeum]
MTILREHNRSRSLETLRSDLLHDLTNTTEGLHFASTTLLRGKADEKEALAVLCPDKTYKATDIAIVHLSKLLVQCNKWLPVLDVQGPMTYWAVVAATTSEMQKIKLSDALAKELVFALLRARQRWILRQDNPRSATTTVKSHFIAGLQRLLQRFEEKDKDPAALNWHKHDEWKLCEKEIREAKARLMGPGRQMASGRIGLSYHAPHPLLPIGQLSSAPMLERNPLGMLDSCVEKITPAEAVQALLSLHALEAAHAENLKAPAELLGMPDDEPQGSFFPSRRGLRKKPPFIGTGHIIPTKLKDKFLPNRTKGPDDDQFLYSRPVRPKGSSIVPIPPVTFKRFPSEEPEDKAPTKKQVFDKGKARSVSTPVVSQSSPARQSSPASQPSLTPGKSTKAARSTSLQVPKTPKTPKN